MLEHHPVLTFHCDPYVPANSISSLSDIVTNGVLLGIYKSWNYEWLQGWNKITLIVISKYRYSFKWKDV